MVQRRIGRWMGSFGREAQAGTAGAGQHHPPGDLAAFEAHGPTGVGPAALPGDGQMPATQAVRGLIGQDLTCERDGRAATLAGWTPEVLASADNADRVNRGGPGTYAPGRWLRWCCCHRGRTRTTSPAPRFSCPCFAYRSSLRPNGRQARIQIIPLPAKPGKCGFFSATNIAEAIPSVNKRLARGRFLPCAPPPRFFWPHFADPRQAGLDFSRLPG